MIYENKIVIGGGQGSGFQDPIQEGDVYAKAFGVNNVLAVSGGGHQVRLHSNGPSGQNNFFLRTPSLNTFQINHSSGVFTYSGVQIAHFQNLNNRFGFAGNSSADFYTGIQRGLARGIVLSRNAYSDNNLNHIILGQTLHTAEGHTIILSNTPASHTRGLNIGEQEYESPGAYNYRDAFFIGNAAAQMLRKVYGNGNLNETFALGHSRTANENDPTNANENDLFLYGKIGVEIVLKNKVKMPDLPHYGSPSDAQNDNNLETHSLFTYGDGQIGIKL